MLRLHRLPVLLLALFCTATGFAQESSAPPMAASAAGSKSEARRNCAPTPGDYPIASLRAGEQGQTRLAFKVTAAGALESVAVIKSSGHARLDYAAMRILKSCALPVDKGSDGQIIEGSYTIDFDWRID